MTNRSVSLNASFEVLDRPLLPLWPIRVTLRFGEEMVQRTTLLGARVGGQYLERVAKIPKRSVLVGYLRREPRQGEELVLRDGSVERSTGIRYRAPSAASASFSAASEDSLYCPPDALELEADDADYALDAACVIDHSSINCGACAATEHRIHGAPGHLVDVPAAHVYAHAAHHQLADAASAAFVRMREAAIAAGAIQATDDYLKLVSGYRSYESQTGIWKERLHAVFTTFGCSNWQAIARAVDSANSALASQTPPLPADAWRDRFRTELGNSGVQVEGCDPARMRAAAAAEGQRVPDTGAIDSVDLAVRIGRQTVAPPGSSPHQTGRAIDMFLGHQPGAGPVSSSHSNVAWQRERPWFQWLVCNASRFGYTPYNREPWHWEFTPPQAAS
jgi:LAS superfamily LD-carboxypeptidase LdcB